MALPPPLPTATPPRSSRLSMQREMWPVWLSLGLMSITIGGLIATGLGFDTAVWYANGWFWLGILLASVVAMIGLAIRTRDRLGQRMQSAILLSIFVHMLLGIVLKEQFISFVFETNRDQNTVEVKPLPKLPNYFIPKRTSRPNERSFEQPVATARATANNSSANRQTDLRAPSTNAKAARSVELESTDNVQPRREQSAPRRSDNPLKMAKRKASAADHAPRQIATPRQRRVSRQSEKIASMRAPTSAAKRISNAKATMKTPRRETSELKVSDTSASLQSARQRADEQRPPSSQSTPRPKRSVEAGRLAQSKANTKAIPRIVRSNSDLARESSTPSLARRAAQAPAARSVAGPTLKTELHESALGQPMKARHTSSNSQPSVSSTAALRSPSIAAELPRATANAHAPRQHQPSVQSATSTARYTLNSLQKRAATLPTASASSGQPSRAAEAPEHMTVASTGSQGQTRRVTRTRQNVAADHNGNKMARRQASQASLAGGSTTAQDPRPSISATESDSEGAVSVELSPSNSELARRQDRGSNRQRGSLGHTSSESRLMQSATADHGSGRPQRATSRLSNSTETGRSQTQAEALSRSAHPASVAGDAATPMEVVEALNGATAADSKLAANDSKLGPSEGSSSERLSQPTSTVRSPRQPDRDVGASVSLVDSGSPGVQDRRASRLSTTSQPSSARFLRRNSAAPATTASGARQPTASFARRSARQRAGNAPQHASPSPQVELAIEHGLDYLASVQLPDGRWTLQHTSPTRVTEPVSRINADSAATGLALLAFLGAGYDHLEGKHRDHVDRGLKFLLAHQKQDGDLYLIQQGSSNEGVWLYSHGIASLALCEAYGMTGDQKLREAAQRALNFTMSAQHPERGGWRYQPGQLSDLSVSGWQLMALRSGQLAGLRVDKNTMKRIKRLLELTESRASAGQYVYNPWGDGTKKNRFGNQPNAVMTSVGLLMQLYSGTNRSDEQIKQGAATLLERLAVNDRPQENLGDGNPSRDTYYWYNATQVMFHLQGEHWDKWQGSLYPLLISSQEDSGPLRGSWDPYHPVPDRWGYYAGRIYFTTMNLLSLEIYHRHLPLFDSALADKPGAS